MAKSSKQSYLILFVIIVLVMVVPIIRTVFSKIYSSKTKTVSRVYNGKYKNKIVEKYPEAFKKAEYIKKEVIKNKVKEEETEDKYNYYTKYYDSKGRIIYTCIQSKNYMPVGGVTVKGNTSKGVRVGVPTEELYIYDDKDRVIKKIISDGGDYYTIDSFRKEKLYSFIKSNSVDVSTIEIIYPIEGERIEVEEYCSNLSWAQVYTKTTKHYKNDILLSEQKLSDKENSNGFIIATVEKKYNEKGELIYKTVERKDKTNDYKSFTEMDFIKDEIVTKYYKGKDVFATVTENLVGPVETIEETEMVNGEKVKKVYKNKVKAIVKRQKVGEPVKIVDVIEYDKKSITSDKDSDKLLTIRYIFDDKGILKYKIIGNKHIQYNYLYDNYVSSKINNFNYYYTNDSFFNLNKKDEMFVYLNNFKTIEKISDKTIEIMDVLEKIIDVEYDNVSIGEINESNYEITNLKENMKKITLEDLLNGYKNE